MICPYCDSLIRTLPDSRTCPQCGAPLGSCIEETRKPKQKLVFPDPPIGIYRCGDVYMQFGENSVRIRKEYPNPMKTDRVIPFHEIVAVKYTAGESFKPGMLSIRDKGNMYVPFPSSFKESMKDSGTVVVHKRDNDEYYRIYLFLKQCADIVNAEDNAE